MRSLEPEIDYETQLGTCEVNAWGFVVGNRLHVRNEFCVNWEPEYDGPVDDEYGTAYHRQWEAAHPFVPVEDRMKSFR